jgi:hypothetical protein
MMQRFVRSIGVATAPAVRQWPSTLSLTWENPVDALIVLVLFGLTIYLLPYIMAGAMILIMLVAGFAAAIVLFIKALFKGR